MYPNSSFSQTPDFQPTISTPSAPLYDPTPPPPSQPAPSAPFIQENNNNNNNNNLLDMFSQPTNQAAPPTSSNDEQLLIDFSNTTTPVPTQTLQNFNTNNNNNNNINFPSNAPSFDYSSTPPTTKTNLNEIYADKSSFQNQPLPPNYPAPTPINSQTQGQAIYNQQYNPPSPTVPFIDVHYAPPTPPMPQQNNQPKPKKQRKRKQKQKQENVDVINFKVDETLAAKKFREWAEGLWFAPTSWTDQADVNNIKKAYIPFFVVSIEVEDLYRAEISFDKSQHNVPKGGKEIPLKFHPQFGKTKRTISDLWYCADNDEHTRKIMKDFKPYKGEISKMNWVSLNQNFKTSACMNWDNFETEVVEPSIQLGELNHCQELIQNSNPTSQYIRDVTVQVEIEEIEMNVVYVPFFIGEYSYNDMKKLFIVNGVNGDASGERPGFGWGSLGNMASGVRDFWNVLTGKEDKEVGAFSGDKLILEDRCHFFDSNFYYIVFPKATGGLFSEHIGTITLTNESPHYILELQAQKRKGIIKGPTVILQPKEKKSFAYKGHWTIKIAYGIITTLVIDVKTSGGGGSACDDLKMKSL